MSNTLTLNNPMSESDWDKIFDVELEKTDHIFFITPSGRRIDFIKADVLDEIKAEIDTPNRGTCDYFIVDRIEEIINKYKAESEDKE